MDIRGTEVIVKEMFFDAIQDEALDRCQLKENLQAEYNTHAVRMHDALRCPGGPGGEHDNKWGIEWQLLELQL